MDNPPQKAANKQKNQTNDDLLDRQLPELLFHIEELRGLVRKYNQIFQLYFIQYLAGFDATALNIILSNMQSLPEEDSLVLSSICQTISSMSVKQVSIFGDITLFLKGGQVLSAIRSSVLDDKPFFKMNPVELCQSNTTNVQRQS